jgi:hypothetical protein
MHQRGNKGEEREGLGKYTEAKRQRSRKNLKKTIYVK